jgi:uncharacterized membrane protein YoaK (UPF0700 family)
MTGNVTQVVIDLVDLAAGSQPGARARLHKMLPPVLTFAMGALAGAMLYALTGYLAVIVPILAIAAVIVLHRRG